MHGYKIIRSKNNIKLLSLIYVGGDFVDILNLYILTLTSSYILHESLEGRVNCNKNSIATIPSLIRGWKSICEILWLLIMFHVDDLFLYNNSCHSKRKLYVTQ